MSVTTVTARLAEILLDIPGIERADAARPKSISPADLPAFMVLTGDAQNDENRSTDDFIYSVRTYRLALLVKPWPTGLEFEAEEAVRPFIDLVNDTFMSRPGLENPKGQNSLDGVLITWLSGDSGILSIELNRIDYAGVEWQLRVEEILPRTYA